MNHPGVMGGPPVGGGKGGKGSKKRLKGESPEGAGNGDTQQVVMRRKPSVKKKKEEESGGGGGVYSSPALPPPYEDCLKSLGEYQQYCSVTSPPASVSPAKGRPVLPTSPTHMAAMRAATQQAALSFPYQIYQTSAGGGGQQGYYHYLTPPSEPAPESFPTPSPESPWHWSSSSPHSNSDWSEGISSPNNAKHHDAIYI